MSVSCQSDGDRPDWRRAHAGSGVTSGLILAYIERQVGPGAIATLLEHAEMTGREAELRDESSWFSFAEKIALWQAAEAVTGDPAVAHHVGASVLELSVGVGIKRAMRALGTPDLVYRNVVRANSKFNWAHTLTLVGRERGRVRLAYHDVAGVGYHRYDCEYTTGLLSTVPLLFGLPAARIEHAVCGVHGDDCCEFAVSWSEGQRGTRRVAMLGGLAAAGLTAASALLDPALIGYGVGLAGATAGLTGLCTTRLLRRRVRALEAQVRDQDVATNAQLQSLAALSSELRLDRALDQITASAGGAIAGARFALLVNEAGQMRADRCSAIPARFVEPLERWANAHQPQLRSGPVVLDTIRHVPGLTALADDPTLPLGSACAAPLMFADKLLGTLIALAPGSTVFLPNDVRSLEIYAGHAAIALWNARLVGRLEREAAEDPLTGLANRRVLGLACDTEIDRTAREGGIVSLIMIDLDHFKRINDTYGHPFGDRVLVEVGGLLRSVVRGHDTVARLGGEEFALLLPGATPDEARIVAERARTQLGAIEMAHGRLSCSAGVASASGPEAEAAELIAAADQALYEAKRRGRGRTVLAPAPQLQS